MAVTIKKRIRDIKKVIEEESRKSGYDWKYPGHDKEFLVKDIIGSDKEEREEALKEIKEEMKNKEYIELTLAKAKKVFPIHANGREFEYSQKKVAFFIWKYSQLLKVIDSKSEREQVLNSLSDSDASLIINHVKSKGITKQANFINDFGELELSRGSALTVRDKTGKIIFIRGPKGNFIPKREEIYITDLSINTIKRAIEELGLFKEEPVETKTTKKPKKINLDNLEK